MKLFYREAEEKDLSSLVELLADDKLGKTREDLSHPINQGYLDALRSILRDSNNELIVVEYEHQLIGMLKLTYIPYLSHIGSKRCLIENVRIQSKFRGKGLGTDFFHWAVQRAKEKKCNMMQLTSDKQRPEALSFYESLGFVASHEGFKLKLLPGLPLTTRHARPSK